MTLKKQEGTGIWRESTRSSWLENSLWKQLWTCRETDRLGKDDDYSGGGGGGGDGGGDDDDDDDDDDDEKTTIVKMTDQWKNLDTLLIIRRVTDTSVNRPSSITGLRIE